MNLIDFVENIEMKILLRFIPLRLERNAFLKVSKKNFVVDIFIPFEKIFLGNI